MFRDPTPTSALTRVAAERGDVHRQLLNTSEHSLARTLDLLAAAPPYRSPGTREVVVVLGTPVSPDGTLGENLTARVRRAAALAESWPNALLMVSGAAVQNRFVEAEAMAAGLVAGGIDPRRIVLEPHARLTLENAAYTLRLIEVHPALRGAPVVLTVVTEPFHAIRALRAFVGASALFHSPPLLRLAAAESTAPATQRDRPHGPPRRVRRPQWFDAAAWAQVEACVGQKALVWLGW